MKQIFKEYQPNPTFLVLFLLLLGSAVFSQNLILRPVPQTPIFGLNGGLGYSFDFFEDTFSGPLDGFGQTYNQFLSGLELRGEVRNLLDVFTFRFFGKFHDPALIFPERVSDLSGVIPGSRSFGAQFLMPFYHYETYSGSSALSRYLRFTGTWAYLEETRTFDFGSLTPGFITEEAEFQSVEDEYTMSFGGFRSSYFLDAGLFDYFAPIGKIDLPLEALLDYTLMGSHFGIGYFFYLEGGALPMILGNDQSYAESGVPETDANWAEFVGPLGLTRNYQGMAIKISLGDRQSFLNHIRTGWGFSAMVELGFGLFTYENSFFSTGSFQANHWSIETNLDWAHELGDLSAILRVGFSFSQGRWEIPESSSGASVSIGKDINTGTSSFNSGEQYQLVGSVVRTSTQLLLGYSLFF